MTQSDGDLRTPESTSPIEASDDIAETLITLAI